MEFKRRSVSRLFARNGQVERLPKLHVGKILLCDFRDGDIRDFDLMGANQMQQQIERTFEIGAAAVTP